ncbi:hypothetical protein Q876_08820 [Listeria monocytogenes]|nr:hypothetical protein [Listeria monocytogenes]
MINVSKVLCDANIWINVCYGNVINKYIEKYKEIHFADKVVNEMAKVKDVQGMDRPYQEYCKRNGSEVRTIYFERLEVNLQQIIKSQMLTFGFWELDNKSKKIKNLGEYMSLMYAYHLNIPYVHSYDNEFQDNVSIGEVFKKFKGIEIISWATVLDIITDENLSEKIRIDNLVMQQNKINKKKKKEKLDLEKLKNHYSSRRL